MGFGGGYVTCTKFCLRIYGWVYLDRRREICSIHDRDLPGRLTLIAMYIYSKHPGDIKSTMPELSFSGPSLPAQL
jgi:hypothetical protein